MTPENAESRRVTGVVLLRADGAALLQHRDDKPGISAPGQWVFPGGHCGEGEPCRDCARREFHEETGYDCRDLEYVTKLSYVCPDIGGEFAVTFWRSRYDGTSPVHCFEGQEVRFLSQAEAARQHTPSYLFDVWNLALAEENSALRRE